MDGRVLYFSSGALALSLASFFFGAWALLPLERMLLGPFQLFLVASGPNDVLWPAAEMGGAFAVPALSAWAAALVHRFRLGALPEPITLLFLYLLPGLAVVAGLLGRAAFLRYALFQLGTTTPSALMQYSPISVTISLNDLDLASWGLRLGVAVGLLDLVWMGLRRSPRSGTAPEPQDCSGPQD